MIKSDLSVAGRDADLLIIRLELLLNLRCSYLAACLSQKILTGKCTARTTIGPGSDQVLGGDLVKTDNTCDCVDYTAVLDGVEHIAHVTTTCGYETDDSQ